MDAKRARKLARVKIGLRMIRVMADRLKLPPSFVDRANNIFNMVQFNMNLADWRKHAMATGCLYVACRQEGAPHSFMEMSNLSKVPRKHLGHAYKRILKRLDIRLEPLQPEDFVSRVSADLGLPGGVGRAANTVARRAVNLDLVLGCPAVSVAAAAVYMTSQASQEKRPKKKVARAAGVCDGAIRRVYKRIHSRAEDLFPEDFEFVTPINRLPRP